MVGLIARFAPEEPIWVLQISIAASKIRLCEFFPFNLNLLKAPADNSTLQTSFLRIRSSFDI